MKGVTMKNMSFFFPHKYWLRRMLTLLVLVALLASYPGQIARAATPGASIPPGHSDRILRLKFVEGTPTENVAALLPAEAWEVIQKIDPLFTPPKSLLKELKVKGDGRLKKEKGDSVPLLPDLSLWYEVRLVQGTDPEAAIALFSAQQEVEHVEPAALMPPAPSTGDYTGLQGYLGSAPGGVDANFAWTQAFGTGAGITIYDVEYGWIQDHEDLSKARNAPLLLNPGDSALISSADHGTAVLGELIADNNGFGVTGLAYDANIKLAPANTANLGWNPANAILLSAADGLPGDVILVEQQTYVCGLPGSLGLGPSEYDLPVFQAIQTATALGLVVVEAAGNGGVDLDQVNCNNKFNRITRDSGAILVGAGGPPTSTYDRQRENHLPTWASSYGSRVDLQGWGSGVMTTGYGDYYGFNEWLDVQYFYTNAFKGTSSASPMVAASAAIIQAVAMARNNAPLSPWQVRDLLASTGHPQLGNTAEKIGPRPNLRSALANLPQSAANLVVNVVGSQNDHLCGATDCSLSEAIERANSDGTDTIIELAAGAAYTLTTANAIDATYGAAGLPLITSPVTIFGAGATIERSSAGGTPEFRLLEVASGGSLALHDVTLRNGKLTGQPGGALLNLGSASVYGSTLTDNSAANGGALASTGSLVVINSTLFHNNASSSGGSIWSSGSLVLTGVTMAGNTAPNTSLVITGTSMVRNTLMVKGASGANCSGTLGTGSTSNMADDSSCGPRTAVKTTAQINLGVLASNGGRTQTMALQAGSAAIDMGNATACLVSKTRNPDQRNYDRFADGNGNGVKECDIGAYEYNSSELLPEAPGPDSPQPLARVALAPSSPDGANGWYSAAPLAKVEARDASGVVEIRCILDPNTPPVAYTDLPEAACPFVGGAAVSEDGFHELYAAALNINSKTSPLVSKSFQVDSTPPVITCPAGGPFLLNSGEQAIGPAGVDASVSGLDEAASMLSGQVTTAAVGPQSLTFTAFDMAGNQASQSCSYNVIYDFSGFYPPIAQAPALNLVTAGSTIPLKWRLLDATGGPVINLSGVTVTAISLSCPAGATQDQIEEYSSGSSSLQYLGDGYYQWNWKSPTTYAGSCKTLKLNLGEGAGYEHFALFQFK